MQEAEPMGSEVCFSFWFPYCFQVAKLTLNLSNQFASQNTLLMWREMLLNPVENWKMTQANEYLICDVKVVLPIFLWIYQMEQLRWHHWNWARKGEHVVAGALSGWAVISWGNHPTGDLILVYLPHLLHSDSPSFCCGSPLCFFSKKNQGFQHLGIHVHCIRDKSEVTFLLALPRPPFKNLSLQQGMNIIPLLI